MASAVWLQCSMMYNTVTLVALVAVTIAAASRRWKIVESYYCGKY